MKFFSMSYSVWDTAKVKPVQADRVAGLVLHPVALLLCYLPPWGWEGAWLHVPEAKSPVYRSRDSPPFHNPFPPNVRDLLWGHVTSRTFEGQVPPRCKLIRVLGADRYRCWVVGEWWMEGRTPRCLMESSLPEGAVSRSVWEEVWTHNSVSLVTPLCSLLSQENMVYHRTNSGCNALCPFYTPTPLRAQVLKFKFFFLLQHQLHKPPTKDQGREGRKHREEKKPH